MFMEPIYKSDFLATQWRMSTNLIERLLMFDLTVVQMKAYVLTKMMRKEFFKPIVGDRLSTFHFKTALMFTVQQTPHNFWTEDNLVQCVMQCLTTMKRFLKLRYSPHYTIAGINLFVDKLKTHEFPVLACMLSECIRTGLKCLFSMKLDDVGERLRIELSAQSFETASLQTREANERSIITEILSHAALLSPIRSVKYDIFKKVKSFPRTQFIEALTSAAEEAGHELRKALFQSTIATVKASDCIRQNVPVPDEMYKTSLTSETLTCYLKFASMLFCTKQYEQTASILSEIEEKINPLLKVLPFPGSTEQVGIRCAKVSTTHAFEYLKTISLPVVFTLHEKNCMPQFLAYEMYATTIPTNKAKTDQYVKGMKDDVIVDSLPYFFYLKFVTNEKLGKTTLQKSAFDKLLTFRWRREHYSENYRPRTRYVSSTMNLIGHCWELNNDFFQATAAYTASQASNPHNNAASWHIFCLIGRFIYGSCTCAGWLGSSS
ncbi:hypothetical protein DPMN_106398 [Dreissena polymorpha]|uniref:Mab-21-like HhH/H2TH-like domain-containing protein n=1 Tax=Dreissena polymorpha TaxID=45954 RepID=A0A9D4K538_DREPO|nr:hypothetical protein DPMN_106398 [Dreissena polymorpha]